MKLNRKKTKDDCKWEKVVARNASAFIASQEQLIGSYRQELGGVRIALAEANKERQKLTEQNERLRGCIKSKEEVEAIMRATYEPLVKEITKEQIDKAVTDTVRQIRPAIIEEVISAVDKAFERQIYESKWIDDKLEVVGFADIGYAIECWENYIKPELKKKFEAENHEN